MNFEIERILLIHVSKSKSKDVGPAISIIDYTTGRSEAIASFKNTILAIKSKKSARKIPVIASLSYNRGQYYVLGLTISFLWSLMKTIFSFPRRNYHNYVNLSLSFADMNTNLIWNKIEMLSFISTTKEKDFSLLIKLTVLIKYDHDLNRLLI